MWKLGLTGGLSVGKSYAASCFVEWGAVLFSGDERAKELLHSHPKIYPEIRAAFGDSVFEDEQVVNAKLARIAFANPENQQILNSIIWPKLSANIAEIRPDAPLVIDAAMLIEAGWQKHCDAVLLVTLDSETQIQRALQRGKLSRTQIEARIKLQMLDSEKKKLADFVVSNNGSFDEFRHKLRIIFEKMQATF